MYCNKNKNKIISRNYLKPESIIRRFPDVSDLLFSIKDLQHYNPQVFEELITNIDAFFDMYIHTVVNKVLLAGRYFQIADSKKHNSVNALHSMIHAVPANRFVVSKLNLAHQRLETLLNRYLNVMYKAVQDQDASIGTNIRTVLINKGPKEANFYFDNYYIYQFY